MQKSITLAIYLNNTFSRPTGAESLLVTHKRGTHIARDMRRKGNTGPKIIDPGITDPGTMAISGGLEPPTC